MLIGLWSWQAAAVAWLATHYQRSLAKGIKPTMARLTLAR